MFAPGSSTPGVIAALGSPCWDRPAIRSGTGWKTTFVNAGGLRLHVGRSTFLSAD
jgi:hypothetical protein